MQRYSIQQQKKKTSKIKKKNKQKNTSTICLFVNETAECERCTFFIRTFLNERIIKTATKKRVDNLLQTTDKIRKNVKKKDTEKISPSQLEIKLKREIIHV